MKSQKKRTTNKTIIIAEAGVNHDGSLEKAKELIDVASDAGADFVKFQTFKAEELVTKKAQKAKYQKALTSNTETHYEMLKRLELTIDNHHELIVYCKSKNIKFLSTAFDLKSIQFLNKLNIEIFKIPSGEITNLPFLRLIGSLGKPVVMSTGMSTLSEVIAAKNVLITSGLEKNNLIVLHCNTEYPTPMIDVNLNAMLTIKKRLGVKIGYSDHTLGIEIPIAAVAMGAEIIEKHFTISRDSSGPDHLASLEPLELAEMVKAIRNIENAFGDGIKRPSRSELKNIKVARKSIVAKKNIKKNELLNDKNLTTKRPGNGVSPMYWDRYIGKRSDRDLKKDELI
jgi:N,N'-diacetyllegionaminate synthase